MIDFDPAGARRPQYLEEWQDLVRRVRIDGPIPTTVEARAIAGAVTLYISIRVDDIATRTPTTIVLRRAVRLRPDLQLLRHIVREAWMHELDERFTVDGQRPFDPHAGESAGSARRS